MILSVPSYLRCGERRLPGRCPRYTHPSTYQSMLLPKSVSLPKGTPTLPPTNRLYYLDKVDQGVGAAGERGGNNLNGSQDSRPENGSSQDQEYGLDYLMFAEFSLLLRTATVRVSINVHPSSDLPIHFTT